MDTKILDLSTVKINSILRVVAKDTTWAYCLVANCSPAVPMNMPWTSDKEKETVKKVPCTDLFLLDFTIVGSSTRVTVPTVTEDTFISVRDKDFEFTFFHASAKEVRHHLKVAELEEVSKLFSETVRKEKKIREQYGGIFDSTMRKLVEKAPQEAS